MTKEDAKQAYALVSLYIALYKNKYNKQPLVNRYREKWAMNDVIETVGYERAKQLLEYYFKCNKIGHPLNWFLYNFDTLDNVLLKSEQDSKYRKDLREQTKNMVEQELHE
jgi:Fic family protein